MTRSGVVGVDASQERHLTVINLSIGALLRLRTQFQAANGHLRFTAIVIDLFSFSAACNLQPFSRDSIKRAKKSNEKSSTTDSNWNPTSDDDMGKRVSPDKAVSKQCVHCCRRVNELGQQSSGIHCEMSVGVGFSVFRWEFEINLDHLSGAGLVWVRGDRVL